MRVILFCVMTALLPFEAFGMQPDDVVARVGERSIQYREIRCDRIWIDQMRRARNDARSSDATCLDVEQARLDLILKNELLDRAAAVAGIEITDADVAAHELPIVRDEAELARYVEFSLALPRAIARVRNGEDPDAVYTDALASRGVARETFDSVCRVFDTKEKVDRYLANDARERTVTSLRRNARLAAVAARLSAVHREEAARTNRRLDDITAEFWQKVVTSTRTAVLHDSYRLPELKDLP